MPTSVGSERPIFDGVGVYVYQLGFRGQDYIAPVEEFLEGVGAHGQHGIHPLEDGPLPRNPQGERPHVLRMRGGEGHLCAPGLVHRQAHQLRQLHGLLHSAVVGEPVAHQHQGAAGVHQQRGGLRDALGAGPGRVVHRAGGRDVHFGHPFQCVGSEADVYRPLGVGVGLVEGPADDAGYLVGKGQLRGPLGHGADEVGQVGDGLVDLAGVVVGGGHHHGGAGVEGVQHEGDAVGQPAVHVEADEGCLPDGPGVGFAHSHRHAFLEGQDIAELRVIAQQVDYRPLAGAGVAEDVVNPLGLEHLKQGLLAGHHLGHGRLPRCAAS